MRRLCNLCLDCNKLSGTALKRLARSIPALRKLSLWGLDGEMNSGNITDHDLECISKDLTVLCHLSIRKIVLTKVTVSTSILRLFVSSGAFDF